MFNGLLASGEQVATAAAVRLYDALLSEAVAALPPGVTRLVIVPDGVLHQLPFEALRSARDVPPLGTRYAVVLAPSATLWLHWRTHPSPAPFGRLLTLADPVVVGSEGNAESRAATLSRGVRLGRLPHAREESMAIARHVGSADVLIGARATERAVKSTDLKRYDVVHVAAHAVADDAHPERSAVILAPGNVTEDGLLQAREIAALDLEGRIVVLSACQTASGAILSGEGVLSLARAFFEAGAHAVIGTRWPLRDEDGAVVFDMFYRHLAKGASLSEALRSSRTEARTAGRPASAWAGLVLIGNGDLRPLATRRAPATQWRLHILPLATTLAILAALGMGLSRLRK
jgi:CHAT domain-containing protein